VVRHIFAGRVPSHRIVDLHVAVNSTDVFIVVVEMQNGFLCISVELQNTSYCYQQHKGLNVKFLIFLFDCLPDLVFLDRLP
jgi:hypothetical protein